MTKCIICNKDFEDLKAHLDSPEGFMCYAVTELIARDYVIGYKPKLDKLYKE